ncbi:ABC transporter substrate-binding protein [Kamptonema cortianum]|nr:ABC transporter substrate-binding protein [Kamptonema cortianum]
MRKPPRKDGRVVVTYWEKWSNFEDAAMRDVVKAFNESQDKIWVEHISTSGIGAKTMLATAGGIPPDVAGLFGTNVAQYAYHNAVIPLDELASEAGIKKEDYIPAFWEFCTYRGKLWALPTTPASTAFHYNTEMLAEVGLKPPTTISELDAMDAALSKTEGNRIVRMGFLPTEPNWWPWSWPGVFGGALWNGFDKITMTREENIAAYKWMASYSKRYGLQNVQSFQQGFGGFDSPQNAFLDRKLASVNQGVWMYNFIEKNRPDLKWAAAPFPRLDGKPVDEYPTVVDLDILVIPRGAKHPKEAFEFIKFVQSQKGMEMLCMGQKKFSPLAKQSEEFERNHPHPYIELFRQAAFSKGQLRPPQTPIWPQWSDEMKSAIEAINLGKMTPHEALSKVEAKMQPILDNVLEVERKRGTLNEETERLAKERA